MPSAGVSIEARHGPQARRRRLSFGSVAGACPAILVASSLLVPTHYAWGMSARSDVTPAETSLAAAQLLESKIRMLSSPGEAAVKSFPPVVITEGEANSYLKFRGQEFLPPGVHDPAIHITPERVSGSANVDFEEFSRAYKNPGDWGPRVLAAMFKGKQKVSASGRLETQNGQGKVKIESLTVGSTAIPDWLVEFILENYLQPRYKMDLSKPFLLPDHVAHIALGSGQATLFRTPTKAR